MADVNTGQEAQGFIFGQNMEERVIKSPGGNEADSTEQSETDTNADGSENKNETGVSDDTVSSTDGSSDVPTSALTPSSAPLLRPSAFKPTPSSTQGAASGILAPSRLGNPFVHRSTASPVSNSHGASNKDSGGAGYATSNPFAILAHSDSDDEKKEKPIVAPAHFKASGASGAGPFSQSGQMLFGQSARANLTPSKFVLRPSTLDKQTANLVKVPADEGPDQGGDAQSAAPANGAHNGLQRHPATEAGGTAASVKPEGAAPSLFLGQSMPPRNLLPDGASRGSASFVFGENLTERATGATPTKASAEGDSPPDSTKSPSDGGAAADKAGEGQSLAESAAALQAKQARPGFSKVEVKTGEEDESNVFQCNVKLFVFNKSNETWMERGRGVLRLNDMCGEDNESFQSRLVMRTQGTLCVVLNTKIWADMLVECPSEKSIRVTAVDGNDGVKIFLIVASRGDVTSMYSAIHARVQRLKTKEAAGSPCPSSPSDVGAAAAASAPPPSGGETAAGAGGATSEKRSIEPHEPADEDQPSKRAKFTRHKGVDSVKSDQPRDLREESNDSSTVDPETEASNESFASSPTVKSSSSEA